jgi:hypothetical protein
MWLLDDKIMKVQTHKKSISKIRSKYSVNMLLYVMLDRQIDRQTDSLFTVHDEYTCIKQ